MLLSVQVLKKKGRGEFVIRLNRYQSVAFIQCSQVYSTDTRIITMDHWGKNASPLELELEIQEYDLKKSMFVNCTMYYPEKKLFDYNSSPPSYAGNSLEGRESPIFKDTYNISDSPEAGDSPIFKHTHPIGDFLQTGDSPILKERKRTRWTCEDIPSPPFLFPL